MQSILVFAENVAFSVHQQIYYPFICRGNTSPSQ